MKNDRYYIISPVKFKYVVKKWWTLNAFGEESSSSWVGVYIMYIH